MKDGTKPKKPSRKTFNLKAFEDFLDAVNRVGLKRKLTQPQVLEKYAFPSLRKELFKVLREDSLTLAGG